MKRHFGRHQSKIYIQLTLYLLQFDIAAKFTFLGGFDGFDYWDGFAQENMVDIFFLPFIESFFMSRNGGIY